MKIEIDSSNKYLDKLIEKYLSVHFGLSLVPAQIEVLKTMLLYDHVLFVHGRAVGATFILAVLSVILRLIDPYINMAVASETVRQAEFLNNEIENKFNQYNLKPLNIVTIDDAVTGRYDVLLLDEMNTISKNNVESLITHIENKSISKIIATCVGYRSYHHIAKLAKCAASWNVWNTKVIAKSYEDMPSDFSAPENIEEAKAMFEYEEEFNMEYKGYVI